MFTLKLSGAVQVEGPHGRLTGRIAQRRQLGVLAALALAPGRTASRDKLLALFWPESGPERARHNLADSVYVVRKELGEAALQSGRVVSRQPTSARTGSPRSASRRGPERHHRD